MSEQYWIGTDIGGTFTDIVVMDEAGDTRVFKTPTTPGNLSDGIIDGLKLASTQFGMSLEQLLQKTTYFAHGTTQATNAFIERKGTPVGLLTTRGFGDTILLQRMMGQTAGLSDEELSHYSLRSHPDPIVAPHRIKEITERIDSEGEVIVQINENEVRQAVRELVADGAKAIAVCFLWSFRNAIHEQICAKIVREEAPELFLSISSDVAPVIGEYERTVTTVLNSYLSPRIESYLINLRERLEANGFKGRCLVLGSSGGVLSFAEAKDHAVSLLTSGPAGGVTGSLHLAKAMGDANVITTDMGGTSFDVGLIIDGQPIKTHREEVDKYHIVSPMIQIHAIGAGGGSIAKVENGQLKVGPESAGAVPGPACYGRRGIHPTVTDADVVLGYVDSDHFLGGNMKLDAKAAEEAILQFVAEPLGLSVHQAAAAIRTIVDNRMADLLRTMTVEKGHDPRDFVIHAYGGAGPVHCAAYGSELGVKSIVVPAAATVHSAYGAIASDLQYVEEVSDPLSTPAGAASPGDYLDADYMESHFMMLTNRALERVKQDGMSEYPVTIQRSVDIRYRRQTHELQVDVPDRRLTPEAMNEVIHSFEESYESHYGKGSAYREAGLEVVNFRVQLSVTMPRPSLMIRERTGTQTLTAPRGSRLVYYFDGSKGIETAIYDGEALTPGQRIQGPAIVEYPGTSIVIPPSASMEVDEYVNAVITPGRSEAKVVMDGQSRVDPVTFEVIRHRLQKITDEQAITLQSVSGSPIVTEATDFCNGLYLEDGSIVSMGRQVLFFAGTTAEVIKSVIKACEDDPGIHDGDMFIVNNPYDGALHPPDVSIVSPIFYNGQLVAWSGSAAHQLDVGGMVFGSWCNKATEIQQECMIIPPLKFVEKGRIRKDVWNMLMSMSRLPHMLSLDFKAMIAANNVARNRMQDLIARYGLSVVHSVMRGLQDHSEQRMRDRLKELPNGTYRAVDFLDHDGHENRIYRFDLALTKQGDRLIADFSGSSPQAPGFINCTRAGLLGGAASGLLPMLAFDIPWNEGIFRVLEIVAPEGIVCNATWPAPISSASCAAVWVVKNVSIAAFSRLVSGSTYYKESMGVTDGSFATLNLAGLNRAGEPFGTMLLDALAGGGGAYADHDGLDGMGAFEIPKPNIANVETNELFSPMLYMFRGFIQDSGGAGRQRGGRAIGLSFIVHGVKKLDALLVTHGAEVPNSIGVFGGLPGSCNVNKLARSTDILERFKQGELPTRLNEVNGKVVELGAKPGHFQLERGDMFEYTFQGGGGYGDPIARDPILVERDIKWGAVSAEAALDIYGVLLGSGQQVDRQATEALRHKIRLDRTKRTRELLSSVPADKNSSSSHQLSLGGFLTLDATEQVIRCRCGSELCSAQNNWRQHVDIRLLNEKEVGRFIRIHKDLEIRAYSCPNCGEQLAVDVAQKGEEVFQDVHIVMPAFVAEQ